jgi:hypothetical protein
MGRGQKYNGCRVACEGATMRNSKQNRRTEKLLDLQLAPRIMASIAWAERINAAESAQFLRGARLLCHAVAGSPLLSKSSIAATKVSISSSGV